MADVTVQLPFPVDLTHERTTAVSMATLNGSLSTLSGTEHSRGDRDWNDLLVLLVADSAVDEGHDCLLEDAVHFPRMLDLAPTCKHAFGAWWQRPGWEACGLDVFSKGSWLSKLEQGDVVIEIPGVPFGVGDYSLHFDVQLGTFSVIPAVLAHSDHKLFWGVFSAGCNTMSGGHHPSW